MDLWSINHILSGVIAGGVLFAIGVSFNVALVISLVLFIGWEVAEASMGIFEHKLNMTMDVVFDLLGFFFSSYFYLTLGKPFSTLAWFVIALITALTLYSGYSAYKRRK